MRILKSFIVCFLLVSSFGLFAADQKNVSSKLNLSKVGDTKDCVASVSKMYMDPSFKIVADDLNKDGRTDYKLVTYKSGARVFEAIDTNYDGEFDDFYIYTEGVLTNREIDSNYDGKIDLWVYLIKGVYVQAYERDSNYDSKIDVVKAY